MHKDPQAVIGQDSSLLDSGSVIDFVVDMRIRLSNISILEDLELVLGPDSLATSKLNWETAVSSSLVDSAVNRSHIQDRLIITVFP